MNLRQRRRLRVLGRRALRAGRRHYVSLVSLVVLGTAGAIALTNASFELPQAASSNRDAAAAQQTVVPAATPPAEPAAVATHSARQVMVYVVLDRAQGDRLILTHNRLVWDNVIAEEYHDMIVRYVVAGSPETEASAIQELNYFIELAALRRDDLRIIDLRGPAAAANSARP